MKRPAIFLFGHAARNGMTPQRTLYLADALADDRGVIASPGAVLVGWTTDWPCVELLATGSPEEAQAHPASVGAHVERLDGSVLLPALVNAHAHLDLTDIGPRPFRKNRGFAGWIGEIRDSRPTENDAIKASVQHGVDKSLAGGVAAVGDIAGDWSMTPIDVLRDSPLIGVSFVECLGLGNRAQAAANRLEEIISASQIDGGGVRLGVQPHAPYSAGRALYERAAQLARRWRLPIATHLAESIDERRCVVDRAGPIREFLDSLGLWDDAADGEFGSAPSPVAHLAGVLSQTQPDAPFLAAHVNDCGDDDLDRLAAMGATVVYCPRASAYFEHERELGPHRYREMIARGVPVALGTDSIVCLPGDEADRLSTLDEMRFLWRRDRTDPATLLAMATTTAAGALGLDMDLFRLTPGRTAGLIAVPTEGAPSDDPLVGLLESGRQPTLLSNPVEHESAGVGAE